MFSRIPDEVFDGFLKPLIINDLGWPFTSVNDNMVVGTGWYRALYPFSLASFSNLRWKRSSFPIYQDILDPVSYGDINLIITNQIANMFSCTPEYSKSSRDTMTGIKEFIKSTGRFPAPIVTAMTPNGIKILDGNHRVAALFDLGLNNSIPIDTWHGTFTTQ